MFFLYQIVHSRGPTRLVSIIRAILILFSLGFLRATSHKRLLNEGAAEGEERTV